MTVERGGQRRRRAAGRRESTPPGGGEEVTAAVSIHFDGRYVCTICATCATVVRWGEWREVSPATENRSGRCECAVFHLDVRRGGAGSRRAVRRPYDTRAEA